jgi:hypothetical protein
MRIIKKIRFLPFYPFFFSLYPLLALTGSNISEITISAIWRLLIFLISSVFVTAILFFFLLRDWHRVALTLSILVLLFFTYGHLYSYLKTVEISGFVLGRHLAFAGWGWECWVAGGLSKLRSEQLLQR